METEESHSNTCTKHTFLPLQVSWEQGRDRLKILSFIFVLATQNPAFTPASQPELNAFKMDSKETDECFPLLGLLEMTLFQKIQSSLGLGGNSHCSLLPALHICWNFLPLKRREHESGSASTQTLLHLSLRVRHR